MIYPIKNIGIIPDGNRRWADMNSMPYSEAYQVSMIVLLKSIKDFIDLISDLENIVIYMMSRRNLSRRRDDLEAVLKAEALACRTGLLELAQLNSLKVIPVGLSSLEEELVPNVSRPVIEEFISSFKMIGDRTRSNGWKKIYLLAGYDPFDEINTVLKGGIYPLSIRDLLIPFKLDLIIRTSNEYRLSDFVPLQSGYAEFLFIDKYFQDLTRMDIEEALSKYYSRTRKFGQ